MLIACGSFKACEARMSVMPVGSKRLHHVHRVTRQEAHFQAQVLRGPTAISTPHTICLQTRRLTLDYCEKIWLNYSCCYGGIQMEFPFQAHVQEKGRSPLLPMRIRSQLDEFLPAKRRAEEQRALSFRPLTKRHLKRPVLVFLLVSGAFGPLPPQPELSATSSAEPVWE